MQTPSLKITDAEVNARLERFVAHLQASNLAGAVLFDNIHALYYTNFAFIPTERPIGLIVTVTGERHLFVPRLEVEHARAMSLVDEVHHYQEYPRDVHPMRALGGVLEKLGLVGKPLGADTDGYPWMLGYTGPSLTEISGSSVTNLTVWLNAALAVKSKAEIDLIRVSSQWANLAHVLLQRYTRVGATETEVSLRASTEATLAMADALGATYRPQHAWISGASANYRGQIGRNSSVPHALAMNAEFRRGDVLVTGATAPVWTYMTELERTMFLGDPTDEQARFFELMKRAQEVAFEAIKPGSTCASVDQAVYAFYLENDLEANWRHHTGHCIGLRYHEGPFLDAGDETVIQPGMVFTVEPGIYAPNIGGFRHSDTVAVTEHGIEMLTYYPRDLESLTIPA